MIARRGRRSYFNGGGYRRCQLTFTLVLPHLQSGISQKSIESSFTLLANPWHSRNTNSLRY